MRLSADDVKAIAEHLIEGLRPIVIQEAQRVAHEEVAKWKREQEQARCASIPPGDTKSEARRALAASKAARKR